MTLIVHALCGYPSVGKFKESGHSISDDHWIGFNLVRSAKGLPFKGTSNITFEGLDYKIDSTSRASVVKIFGGWAGSRLNSIGVSSATLVPVPSSSLTVFGGECTASMLAKAISDRYEQYPTSHVLAFKEAREADHVKKSTADGDGPRRQSKDAIFANLKCSADPQSSRVVLIDDVCTQGRHLLACAALLRNRGFTVDLAMCLGKTIWEPNDKVLQMEPEDLEANVFPSFDS